jgi:hypothetical protein
VSQALGDSFRGVGGAILSRQVGFSFSGPSVTGLSVSDTQFDNNSVLGSPRAVGSLDSEVGLAAGGAVAIVQDGLDTFTRDTFNANKAYGGIDDINGSGTYTIGQAQGGAIDVNEGDVTFRTCSFSGNGAQGGRGIDVAGTSGRIGFALGGAIEVESQAGGLSSVDVETSTFTNNYAQGANSGTGLGTSLTNAGLGGAISAEGPFAGVSIGGSSSFNANVAQGGFSGFSTASGGNPGSPGKGGAIYVGGGADAVISATFTNNFAHGGNGKGDGRGGFADGGAIEMNSPGFCNIFGSQFDQNSALGGNGGTQGGSGGQAAGGALFIDGSAGPATIDLTQVQFTRNRATGGAGHGTGAVGGTAFGGALVVDFENLIADRITVQGNQATGGSGTSGANGGNAFGGGIFAADNMECIIADSTVTQNTAGGGLANQGGTSGSAGGGGIYSLTNPLAGANTTVTGNGPDNIESV